MPGKKGMHWEKPKVNATKMNIYLSEETDNKITLLSNIIKKAKKEKNKADDELERDSPSGLASLIIEKNIENFFNETVKFLNNLFEEENSNKKVGYHNKK